MKYIVTYTAKRKNAKRHVVNNYGKTVYFNSIEEAKNCYMFRNENYNVQVMTSKYDPVD